jgi:hypothetical protein
MVQTVKPATPAAEADFEVLRPICINGERVEVGAVVRLSRVTATECMAAGKVKPAEPKPAKPAKAKPAETQEPAP